MKNRFLMLFLFISMVCSISGVSTQTFIYEDNPVCGGYTLKYHTNNGYSDQNIFVRLGSNLNLDVPARNGYTFDGWYYDAALTNKVSATKEINLSESY